MKGPWKVLVVHGDKLLLVLLVVFGLYHISIGLGDLTLTPTVVQNALSTVSDVEEALPLLPVLPDADFARQYVEKKRWNVNRRVWPRSIFYLREDINFEADNQMYKLALQQHDHLMLDTADGKARCVFPGCKEFIDVNSDYIGPCQELESKGSSIMSISLAWKGPASIGRGTLVQYCVVERRYFKAGQSLQDGWLDVVDENKEPVMVSPGHEVKADAGRGGVQGGGDEQDQFVWGEDLGGPNTVGNSESDGQNPTRGQVKGPEASQMTKELTRVKVTPAEALALLTNADEAIEPQQAEKKRIFQKRLRTIGMDEDKARSILSAMLGQAATVTAEAAKNDGYRLTDVGLDADMVYEYRVRAVGVNDKGMPARGEWSKVLKVKTEKDQGARFVSYMPPAIVGGVVKSPARVTVKLSKLYSPSWTEGRWFIYYDNRDIIPGDSTHNVVGGLRQLYGIDGPEGYPVLIDAVKKELMLGGADYRNKLSNTLKIHREDVDFSTPWLADRVEEQVDTEPSVVNKVDPQTGQLYSETIEKKKYRYFLILKDTSNKDADKELRLELERKSYSAPLRPMRVQ